MIYLNLYTTAGCHLCELAIEEINSAITHTSASINTIEIGDDDALIAQYGTRIPVIRFADGEELNWPFSTAEISARIDSLPEL